MSCKRTVRPSPKYDQRFVSKVYRERKREQVKELDMKLNEAINFNQSLKHKIKILNELLDNLKMEICKINIV